MFRKPKKKPSALRGKAGGSTGGFSSAPAPSAGRKRRRARSPSSSSEEDDDGEEGTSDLLEQLRQERDDAARSKKSSSGAALLNTSSTSSKAKSMDGKNNWMHQYKSGDGRMTAQEMATRTAEYHPTEKAAPRGDGDGEGDGAARQNANVAGLQKQPRNKFLAGPLRAATFVRTTARFDYQPDICKDYKETGFCGFGDTCIYLHDRGDTKSGWQLEAEYEEEKKRKEERKSREMENFMKSMMDGEEAQCPLANEEGGGSGTDDGIPFACHICRGPFKNPVVTPCGHYFCEGCLLGRMREEGTVCPISQKDTHGIMNHPQKLIAKKRRLVGRDGTWEEYLERSKKGSSDDADAS